MYQAYPGGDQSPQQYGQPGQPALAVPQSVARAVKLMYVGAAASLVGIIVDVLARHSLRTYIAEHVRSNGKALTNAQVTNAYHLELGVLIAAGLIGVGLWLWMARSCQAGKGWARITSTVFFAIDTISALTAVSGAGQLGGASAGRFFGLVVWLIGLGAIILLWQRQSSDYFKGAPRY